MMGAAAAMMKPDQAASWVARALPGDDVVYDFGVRPGDAIGATMRAMHEAGVVALTSKRVDGGFRFIAQRLPDPRPPRPSELRARVRVQRGRFAPRSDDSRRTTRAVLRVLTQAAARHLPCPTNAEIAARVGLTGAVAASYRVRRLVKDGKIIVEEPSPLERRVVTIVATGKQTRRAML